MFCSYSQPFVYTKSSKVDINLGLVNCYFVCAIVRLTHLIKYMHERTEAFDAMLVSSLYRQYKVFPNLPSAYSSIIWQMNRSEWKWPFSKLTVRSWAKNKCVVGLEHGEKDFIEFSLAMFNFKKLLFSCSSLIKHFFQFYLKIKLGPIESTQYPIHENRNENFLGFMVLEI